MLKCKQRQMIFGLIIALLMSSFPLHPLLAQSVGEDPDFSINDSLPSLVILPLEDNASGDELLLPDDSSEPTNPTEPKEFNQQLINFCSMNDQTGQLFTPSYPFCENLGAYQNNFNPLNSNGDYQVDASYFSLLNPNALDQIVFWNMVATFYFEYKKEYPISAMLLRYSVTINPKDLYLTEKYNLDIITKIKNTDEYNEYIAQIISKNNIISQSSFKNVEIGDKSLTFEEGDLAYSIHGTHKTEITGKKDNAGQWAINVKIYDVYDFELQFNLKDLTTSLGVDAAYISQVQGVISNYNIIIEFNDLIK